MSRPLSPFVRHLGEARYRSRLILAAAGRLERAAVDVAGLAADPAELAAAIAVLREHVALLERQAVRWREERAPAKPARSTALRAEIADLLARDTPRGS